MNSPAWAWNEDSYTIVQKNYFYYLFQERSYPSQNAARVRMTRTILKKCTVSEMGADRLGRESGFAIAIFKASCAEKKNILATYLQKSVCISK